MTERELAKNATRRLAIILHAEEVTGSVGKTCRHYGNVRAHSTGTSSTKVWATSTYVLLALG